MFATSIRLLTRLSFLLHLCRERDTTDQRIGLIDEVIAVVSELVNGNMTWDEACQRLPAYDGVQAVE